MVSVGGAQKHPADLLHPGIHLLPSSGSPPLPFAKGSLTGNPSHASWSGSGPACLPTSCSTALWTVGAAVGPKLREKKEIDHAVSMMLRHDRLRCEQNVGSAQEESLFTPW